MKYFRKVIAVFAIVAGISSLNAAPPVSVDPTWGPFEMTITDVSVTQWGTNVYFTYNGKSFYAILNPNNPNIKETTALLMTGVASGKKMFATFNSSIESPSRTVIYDLYME